MKRPYRHYPRLFQTPDGPHTQRVLRAMRGMATPAALRWSIEATGARRVVITEPEPLHVLVTYSGGPAEDVMGDVVDMHRPAHVYIGVRRRKTPSTRALIFWAGVVMLLAGAVKCVIDFISVVSR